MKQSKISEFKIEGKLGDNRKYTNKIRTHANKIIKNDIWDIEDVDLSKVTFETRTRAKKRHGVTEYKEDNECIIGISKHTIDNAGFESAKDTIRHELVHVWQHQHSGKKMKLPNGRTVNNITTGHTGSWYDWANILNLSRKSFKYSKEPEDYKYRIYCYSCHRFKSGNHRLCKTIKYHSESIGYGYGWCENCDEEDKAGSTFIVTDDKNDKFYNNKENHNKW